MTLLPSAAGNIFSLCWFACLFLLGIDSMFAMGTLTFLRCVSLLVFLALHVTCSASTRCDNWGTEP